MVTRTRILAVLAGTAALTTAANAQFTAYNNQADWEADLLGAGYSPFTNTLDGLESGDLNPGDAPFMISSDISFTVEGGPGNAGDAFFSGGTFHGELFPADRHSAYVHTFSSPVVGFGQFFDGAASGLGLRIQTLEGTVDIFDDGGYSGFEDGFLGFISTSPITEVRIIGSDADGGSAVGEIYDANDISYAMVPAPGALALLGLGGVAAVRRRR